ncbi:50S ribosomal protein L3 [Blochmannia endosymbiont of Camponotus sp.]|uniref:50S ribosomal protein L3 n=1 Tax=Blochmannia endosymbiont of Camponotus sp. TaxID=700220 RepID=UPI002024CDC6|nr:50S ribosomal protein L3 [Blochmannia endosymbiont of Camponotus sp.]URJ30177.1 50S ribosomal protein L3 [Blochmannia endosymbiont of Camponotus sp.]URJ30928.1 50S ribosomal protein L3 [Blochmannia endosymbiont of Camponotus sp.]
MKGLIGKKLGMTRLFNEEGLSIPVTMIEIKPNYVTQIKNTKKDGYFAVQVTTGIKNTKHVNKPEIGHMLKSGIDPGRGLWEFRCENKTEISVGDIFTIQIFIDIRKVDITGISKGKGFAGTIKRWNFHMQDATHGNSLSHRAPGSIGQNQTPGKVFKGKKMAGQLGNYKVTVQNLNVISVDVKRNLLLVKGAVPGIIGGNLAIKKSIKVQY